MCFCLRYFCAMHRDSDAQFGAFAEKKRELSLKYITVGCQLASRISARIDIRKGPEHKNVLLILLSDMSAC